MPKITGTALRHVESHAWPRLCAKIGDVNSKVAARDKSEFVAGLINRLAHSLKRVAGQQFVLVRFILVSRLFGGLGIRSSCHRQNDFGSLTKDYIKEICFNMPLNLLGRDKPNILLDEVFSRGPCFVFVSFFPEDLGSISLRNQFQTTKRSQKRDICEISNAFSAPNSRLKFHHLSWEQALGPH